MKRRGFLAAAGAGITAALAGCASQSSSDDSLVVGTYSSFLDAPSISPGEWLKGEFESEFDTTLVWQSPPEEMNHYIQRKQEDVSVDADVYLGLNTDEIVRIDDELDGSLLAEAPSIEGRDSVKEGLRFDPEQRAVPFNTGYISLVYDGTETEAPTTFDGLLEEEYSGDLIAQNPGTSATGRAFMLHTIDAFGTDGEYTYLDYWSDLQENGVTILGQWGDAYGAWQEGEAPIVVSYSTDQVFADQEGANLEEHQVRFLNDQAYANPEGMAMFEAADEALVRDFMEFMLRPEIQGEIAQRNVAFPATDTAELPADYNDLAREPPDPVTFSYEDLRGSVEGWIDDWEREIVQ